MRKNWHAATPPNGMRNWERDMDLDPEPPGNPNQNTTAKYSCRMDTPAKLRHETIAKTQSNPLAVSPPSLLPNTKRHTEYLARLRRFSTPCALEGANRRYAAKEIWELFANDINRCTYKNQLSQASRITLRLRKKPEY
jgi:hypothetical protein